MRGLRILTLAPRVTEHAGVLRARTPVLLRILSLGSFCREVVVDRRARYVTIDARYAWLIHRKRVIPFRQIHRIAYDYEQTTTSLQRGYVGGVQAGDQIDEFQVSLILRTRDDVPETHAHLFEERVELFSFHGDGRGQTYAIDLEGQQEALSRHYVERLRALTGASFGLELTPLQDQVGRTWSCEQCSRPGPPRPGKCYYCGGSLAAR